jgi:hypothetical protein
MTLLSINPAYQRYPSTATTRAAIMINRDMARLLLLNCLVPANPLELNHY